MKRYAFNDSIILISIQNTIQCRTRQTEAEQYIGGRVHKIQ